MEAQPVKDKYFVTYILFYAFGTVSLITSKFFSTATDYWMYKFRDPQSNLSLDSENRTGLQAEFAADFSIDTHVSNAVFIVISIILLKKSTMRTKIIGGLSGAVLMFLLTCVFVRIDTDTWQMGFLVFTLVIGCVLSGCCSVVMVTAFQMAPKFPPTYLEVVIVGQAFCGVLAAVAQVVALSVDEDAEDQGIVYFGFALVLVTVTLVLFLACLKECRFFKHHFYKEIEEQKRQISIEKIISIVKKVKYYLLAMFISTGTTVVIEPGLTSLVVSMHKSDGSDWNKLYFGPVISFLVYCIADFTGRQLGVILKKPRNGLVILSISCIRLAMIPLIMLCNAQPRDNLPVIFNEDYYYIIFIIVLALSHGFLLNLCAHFVGTVPTEEERPLATFFVLIFMIVSMAACSFVGTALVKVL